MDGRCIIPKIGEVRLSQEIGYGGRSLKYIWRSCLDCGRERWVHLVKGRASPRCRGCASQHPPHWKGGRIKVRGYIRVLLQPKDPSYLMADKGGYVLEHRLVMARHLGRCLLPWELVHHKNHIKDDNHIENLQLVSRDGHRQITILENEILHQQKRIILLESENTLLREQLELCPQLVGREIV